MTAAWPEPTYYAVRVSGHLDQRWSAWFGGINMEHEGKGTTLLGGALPDQAALHGLLAKVRDLGLVLISVEAVDMPDGGTGAGAAVVMS